MTLQELINNVTTYIASNKLKTSFSYMARIKGIWEVGFKDGIVLQTDKDDESKLIAYMVSNGVVRGGRKLKKLW